MAYGVMEREVSARFFAPLSSPLRLRILRLLQAYTSLSYTELMRKLGLDPVRDAGKFAYHMKVLLEANLIEQQPERREYALTELGKLAISLCRDMEETLRERRRLLVRTSRYAIEEFDRTKIAKALIREAKLPAHLASRIAEEAEERLLRLRVKYLTAPLIREFVNALLIEEGLEEYRHKLTRLGMPVYDVKVKMDEASKRGIPMEEVRVRAGASVLEEYTLLAALPREVADAYLEGSLHLVGMSSWTSKPNDVRCDLRTFLAHGLKIPRLLSLPPPKSFRACLTMLRLLALVAHRELEKELVLPLFNVMLAPYVRGLEDQRLIEELRFFMWEISTIAGNLALDMMPTIPSHLYDEAAVEPGGELGSSYGHFEEEASKLFLMTIQELENLHGRPLLNPALLIGLEDPSFTKARDLLLAAHELAAKNGIPYFASKREFASYSSFASRLAQDWRRDWELDTLRTGCLGQVVINVPRLARSSGGNYERLLELLEKNLEIAAQALRIKHACIAKRLSDRTLPLLAYEIHGEPYFRIDNASCELALLDLDQAVAAQTGQWILESRRALKLALRMLQHTRDFVNDLSECEGMRFLISQAADYEALSRLTELDAGVFGRRVGEYSVALHECERASIPQKLEAFSQLCRFSPGGAFISIAAHGGTPQGLLRITEWAFGLGVPLIAFDVELTYCEHCRKAFRRTLPKCPECKSSAIVRSSRSGTKLRFD